MIFLALFLFASEDIKYSLSSVSPPKLILIHVDVPLGNTLCVGMNDLLVLMVFDFSIPDI